MTDVREFPEAQIVTPEGVTYVPFVDLDDGRTGYTCRHEDGRVVLLYFNPSSDSDDGQPNVFVYMGYDGTPASDQPLHHYNVFAPEES